MGKQYESLDPNVTGDAHPFFFQFSARQTEANGWARQRVVVAVMGARPPWVSDVDAEARFAKYACTQDEVDARRRARTSAHASEVRRERYAQFDDAVDEVEVCGNDGSDEDDEDELRTKARTRATTTTTVDGDGRGARAVAFDLDMALFWARRRAAAARERESLKETTMTTKTTTKNNRVAPHNDIDDEDDDAHFSHAREVEELRQRLRQERSARARLTEKLEQKVAEIERLRSIVAKLKLDSEKREQQEKLLRYPGQRERMRLAKIRENQLNGDGEERESENLPSYAAMRRETTNAKKTAWFVRTR
jgi:hypothetical protein